MPVWFERLFRKFMFVVAFLVLREVSVIEFLCWVLGDRETESPLEPSSVCVAVFCNSSLGACEGIESMVGN